jgi:molecular chaperone GrpE
MKSDEFDQDTSEAASASEQEINSAQTPAYEEAGQPEPGASGNDELDALRDRYLRLAAEYDNYRKRTDRERAEGRDRAQAQVVEKLLEPLDDLQRVAQFSAENTTLESVLEGVRMVERKLAKALEAAGLEIVEARGARFDPSMHDALMMAPTEDAAEDDTVGEVFQTGYRFRGTLLRPARVQVRKHG